MKKLPIKEKIRLTSGQYGWHFMDSEYLDTKKFIVSDGPHGVRVYKEEVTLDNILDTSNLAPATMFPSASLMASSFNPKLMYQVGSTIAKECRHYGVDGLLGPGINLKRSPLGGRNFEYYSEDPFLTKELAVEFVRGVQDQGVKATIKHFGLNEQETMRRFVNTNVDERTMHELYLYPFRKVIEESSPAMVMSSYNKLNGIYASENKTLLQDVLRGQLGFKGVVISDWGAVQDKVLSIKSGMNVEMPGPSEFDHQVLEAVNKGLLTEEEIDESLEPLFEMIENHTLKPLDISLEENHTVAKRIADEGIVLLENDGILPLRDRTIKLGVIGEFATKPRVNGGGSATLNPYMIDVPYDLLKQQFKNIDYAHGYIEDKTNAELLSGVSDVAKNSEIVLYFLGTTESQETEGKDRKNLDVPKAHIDVLKRIYDKNKNIIAILSNGSALDLREVKHYSKAILETWFSGGAGGSALVDIILGKVNPSGRLQETFPLSIKHTPHYKYFGQQVEVKYHQDIVRNGYRYYDTHDYPVLYPFGYGLSYSKINYDLVDIKDINDNKLIINVELSNHSSVDGHEVVQVYVKNHLTDLPMPEHTLKAFKKVFVPAHQSVTFSIILDKDAFETYDINTHAFVVYNTDYTVQVARNSKDIIAKRKITINDQVEFKLRVDLTYPLHAFVKYYPEIADEFFHKYRQLQWYELEEPFQRLINRYKREKQVPSLEIEEYIQSIKEKINV